MASAALSAAIPRLQNGDRLTRAEFERRYDADPTLKKAELIDGVVYMPSPVRQEFHSRQHFDIIACLGLYRMTTPGVEGGDNGTLRLDLDNVPQPDAFLFIRPEWGGHVRIDEDGYVTKAPDLVAEVAASSVSYDLHQKLNTYRRHRVKEYVVWRVEDDAIDWFVLRRGKYRSMSAKDGVHRCTVFPGFWLDAAALIQGDLATVYRVLQDGVESQEHEAFVRKLAAIKSRSAKLGQR